jgi:ADP-ribose pyrophosphatase YjhB (NUDIX family)
VKYCPDCGARIVRSLAPGDSRTRTVCDSCGAIHYHNPKVLVFCMAYWGGSILLCRRAHAPARGLWCVPGGFVETNETLEEATARETHEETGIFIRPSSLHLCAVVSLPHINEIYVGYRAPLKRPPRLCAGSECLDVELFAEQKLPLRELAFRNMMTPYYQTFYSHIRRRRFPILKMHSRNSANDSRPLAAGPR